MVGVFHQDDLELLPANGSPVLRSPTGSKRPGGPLEPIAGGPQHHTEEALKELFRHVHHNMPDSAKKKKLIQQVNSLDWVVMGTGVER